MKENIKIELGVLVLVLMMCWMCFSGIQELTNQSNRKEIVVNRAANILSVEHSIDGLIPTGTDYYYLVSEKGTKKLYIVKAGKKWLSKNFDSRGHAIQANGCYMEALQKDNLGYKTENALRQRIDQLGSVVQAQEKLTYLELNYKRNAMLKISIVIAGLLVAALGFLLYRNMDDMSLGVSKGVAGVIGVLIIFICIAMFRIDF